MKTARYQTGSHFITLINSTQADRENLHRNGFDVRKTGEKTFGVQIRQKTLSQMFRVSAYIQELGYILKAGV